MVDACRKRQAWRRKFQDAQSAERRRKKDLRLKAKAAGNFLTICLGALNRCSIVGTVLNGARKDVISGDYSIAREKMEKALNHYILLGAQLTLLDKQLQQAEGYEDEK